MSRQPRLWVIDPSVHEAEDQCVEQVLRDWPGQFRLFQPALRPGDCPGPGDDHEADGFVLLGSAASVHDGLPWIARLTQWLGPLLDGQCLRPLLGICFGHQLIAHRAGARVADLRADGQKELGVRETRLEASRLTPQPCNARVLVSHREGVCSMPPGYRVIARRPGVPVDGLEHERLDVFSYQFHPEARDQFATRRGLDPAVIDSRLIRDSDRLLGAFRQLVIARFRG